MCVPSRPCTLAPLANQSDATGAGSGPVAILVHWMREQGELHSVKLEKPPLGGVHLPMSPPGKISPFL